MSRPFQGRDLGTTLLVLLLSLVFLPAVAGTVVVGAATSARADVANAPVSGFGGSLTAGDTHACAINALGQLRCWGFYGQGRLGYGNSEPIGDNETPVGTEATPVGPVNLGEGRTAVAVSAGAEHTCAILDTGAVKCWGLGSFGRLGYGNETTIGIDETPAAVGTVDLGAGRTAKAVSAGAFHTCALLDNDDVRCWGFAIRGQLGYAHLDRIGDDETPGTQPALDFGAGRTAVAISSGSNHNCAILDDGSVRCWGSNFQGQLGYGHTTHTQSGGPNAFGAVNLGVGRTATAIAAFDSSTCAVLDNGSLICWGQNQYGELGRGALVEGSPPQIGDNETPGSVAPVFLGAGRTAVGVSGGTNHVCVILDDASTLCWGNGVAKLGYGAVGDLGDDEAVDAHGPVLVGAGRAVKALALGSAFTCAALDAGDLLCWGDSLDGQLGHGNTDTIGDNESPGTTIFTPIGGPLYQDVGPPDADGDGVTDAQDNCPAVANADQLDSDGDGAGNACDPFPFDPADDVDGDAVGADTDNCPALANPDQEDADGDDLGNACDPFPNDPANDVDGDGVGADTDNCDSVPNAGQGDLDDDGVGDACDTKDDRPRCKGKVVTIAGVGQGPAVLNGTAADDVILGTPGKDKIDGKGGDDTICAGGGNDAVKGEGGNDVVDLGSGDDVADGGDGKDTVIGGAGKDRISGAKADDNLNGGGGDDLLAGAAGNDNVVGGAGKDSCSGGAGKDTNAGCETKSQFP